MCCRIAQPPEQPNGSVSTLRSKLSAAIAAVFMRRAHEKARLRRGRWLGNSISCRENLRVTIETQLRVRADRSTGRALFQESNDEDVVTIANGPGGRGEVAEHRHLTRQAHRRSQQAVFDQIHTLREAGTSIGDMARETGFGPRSIRKWLKVGTPLERHAAAPNPGTQLFP